METRGSRGGYVAWPWYRAEYEPSMATGVEKPAMGLGVGDSGWRLDAVPGNEGDLVGCSDGLLNEGVAAEYCSRALICWE